jgi:hypothetical protein
VRREFTHNFSPSGLKKDRCHADPTALRETLRIASRTCEAVVNVPAVASNGLLLWLSANLSQQPRSVKQRSPIAER